MIETRSFHIFAYKTRWQRQFRKGLYSSKIDKSMADYTISENIFYWLPNFYYWRIFDWVGLWKSIKTITTLQFKTKIFNNFIKTYGLLHWFKKKPTIWFLIFHIFKIKTFLKKPNHHQLKKLWNILQTTLTSFPLTSLPISQS